MPLISAIGRKALPVRILIGAIYVLLILGGVTMVYPLLLMVSGSVKGSFDARELDLVPRFLKDERTLFQRYLESKYGESLAFLNQAWGSDVLKWEEIKPDQSVSQRQLDDFDEFRRAAQFPSRWTQLGHAGPAALNQRGFKRDLLHASGGDLVRLGEMCGTTFRSWADVVPVEYGFSRMMETPDKLVDQTERYKRTRPVEEWIIGDVEANWKTVTLLPRYELRIEMFRQATGEPVQSWADVHMPRMAVALTNSTVKADWEAYVRNKVPFAFLQVDPAATRMFQDYLRRTYGDDLSRLNKAYGTSYQSSDEIQIASAHTFTGTGYIDFNRFIREVVPLEMLSLDGPNFRYRDFVQKRFHGDLDAACSAYGVSWKTFEDASMPTAAMDWRDFQQNKSSLRREFLTRNYGYILDFLARHGRGFQNTGILVVLFLVTQLTVNPLAAYALSRFGLPSTYKIQLICMATVAFPGEVMMIPSFLQLKEFGLLNTFGALVLPGLANGYSIFLLKGFFDSLPQELYESATIDGASEWTIFWQITMSLSKPILAVMALGAFTSAYGTFFYALIICPDEQMWTLMVWLYQLQMMGNSPSINYAALCVSSIPTLLVFIFCQRIILRGIVVPSEK